MQQDKLGAGQVRQFLNLGQEERIGFTAIKCDEDFLEHCNLMKES
jgi:hypothetical protein